MSKNVKVYVNRMKENGDNVILISDSQTCSCKKYEISKEINTRDYIVWLLAQDIKAIYDLMATKQLNPNASYYFILDSMGKEIATKKTRNNYLLNKKTNKGIDLPENFLGNLKLIDSLLNYFEDNGIRVRLYNRYMATPHEYNGRTYGSENNVKIIAKTWDALDKIVPRKETIIDDNVEFKIEDAI